MYQIFESILELTLYSCPFFFSLSLTVMVVVTIEKIGKEPSIHPNREANGTFIITSLPSIRSMTWAKNRGQWLVDFDPRLFPDRYALMNSWPLPLFVSGMSKSIRLYSIIFGCRSSPSKRVKDFKRVRVDFYENQIFLTWGGLVSICSQGFMGCFISRWRHFKMAWSFKFVFDCSSLALFGQIRQTTRSK